MICELIVRTDDRLCGTISHSMHAVLKLTVLSFCGDTKSPFLAVSTHMTKSSYNHKHNNQEQ